eukprot:15409771-Alexandrium_andersonii.AAC.1
MRESLLRSTLQPQGTGSRETRTFYAHPLFQLPILRGRGNGLAAAISGSVGATQPKEGGGLPKQPPRDPRDERTTEHAGDVNIGDSGRRPKQATR